MVIDYIQLSAPFCLQLERVKGFASLFLQLYWCSCHIDLQFDQTKLSHFEQLQRRRAFAPRKARKHDAVYRRLKCLLRNKINLHHFCRRKTRGNETRERGGHKISKDQSTMVACQIIYYHYHLLSVMLRSTNYKNMLAWWMAWPTNCKVKSQFYETHTQCGTEC